MSLRKQYSKKESYCMKSTRPVAVITGAARGIGKGCAL
ncbi:3-ketoacyl-ACP reductase, partial [Escherichia coli]|nr:3-ketoacyl-ACP reductase [Escherichia coli]